MNTKLFRLALVALMAQGLIAGTASAAHEQKREKNAIECLNDNLSCFSKCTKGHQCASHQCEGTCTQSFHGCMKTQQS